MDIEDAFTTEAIEALDTNLDVEDEATVREVIKRIYTTNDLQQPTDDHLNVAVLCFVAGRTYQDMGSPPSGPPLVEIPMTPDEVHQYIAYLSQRGAP